MAESIHGRPMNGRTVLVTGATSGIGQATAIGLARMGAHLAIAGRDPRRTDAAARDLRMAGGGQVDMFVADLSSQAEVRRLAQEVLQRLPRIDVLVNNVGGFWNTRHLTVDGLEHTAARLWQISADLVGLTPDLSSPCAALLRPLEPKAGTSRCP